MQDNNKKDIVLTVNVVEDELVHAVNLLSQHMGYSLKGLVLVDKEYSKIPDRPKDTSGLFEEIICDFTDQNEIQKCILPFQDKVLVATCRYEEAQQQFAKLIPFLPYINTPSSESLYWSTEKNLMRNRLATYDRNLVPKFLYIDEIDWQEINDNIKDFKYPLIVKPSGLSKSLFVNKCSNYKELLENVQNAMNSIHEIYEKEQYPGKPALLIEEMMIGDMYSTDAYVSHDGKVTLLPLVSIKTAHAAGLKGFYGYEQRLPAVIINDESSEAFKAATKSIRALNLSSTSVHIELMKTADGWKIIELGARLGGYRAAMYKQAYGLEHYLNDLLIRLGKDPIIPSKIKKHVAIVKLYSEEEGTFQGYEGLPLDENISSLVKVRKLLQPGDFAKHAIHGGDHHIEFFLAHENHMLLKNDIDKIQKNVRVKVSH